MTEANYKRITCAHCNSVFQSTRKNKKYCTVKCSRKAQDRKRNPLTRAEYEASRKKAANYFKCEHCGKDSYRNISGTNTGPNRFCCMQCMKDAAAAKRPAKVDVFLSKPCTVCNAAFVGRASKTRCSKACDLAHGRMRTLQFVLARHRQAARVVTCEQCECRFSPLYGASHATLCVPCAEERARVAKRIAKMQRKALTLGVDAERVDPFKVFARDKWRCRLCGVSTPKSKRGTHDDNAPELDHIIPISKGGAHTYLNTQCACRRCNNKKSDKAMGQLLLIG